MRLKHLPLRSRPERLTLHRQSCRILDIPARLLLSLQQRLQRAPQRAAVPANKLLRQLKQESVAVTVSASALSALASRIEAVLPQTQCTRCGYPDCAQYAQAVAASQAGTNQCPPGGAEGVKRIAALVGQAPASLNPDCGAETPRVLAVIDEEWCIGCTLCLDACPTDAILGANKRMHTVVAEHCTGCGLCLPVCPVDCIALVNASGTRTGWDAWSAEQAGNASARYTRHRDRFLTSMPLSVSSGPANSEDKKDKVAAALARAREQRSL